MSFKPLLAEKVEDPADLKFPVIVSPKLDGIRCLIRHGQALTRSLKPIPNRFISSELHGLPDFDGELIVGDPTDPTTWNETSSGVMSHDGEPDFTYWVFDSTGPQDSQFQIRLSFATRRTAMYGPRVKPLYHRTVHNLTELMEFEEQCVGGGYEGVMIRDPHGKYKYGRSTLKEGILLKMKRWDDSEAVVTGVIEKMHNANEAKTNALGRTERSHKQEGMVPAGTLGALTCKFLDTGVEFEVGTGFDDAQRADYWAAHEDWANTEAGVIGRVIRVKHQGLTTTGKPRFPVFQGFRDKRDMS